MSRQSEKLNFIDQNTFTSIQHKEDKTTQRNAPRSSKYRNHQKKHEQETTLLDFVIKPRQSQKHIKARKLKRPNLAIAKSSFLATKTKRKGKTRLNAKKKVTKLKRLIRSYRSLKRKKQSVGENPELPMTELENLSLTEKVALVEAIPQSKPTHSIHSRRFRRLAYIVYHWKFMKLIKVFPSSYCDNCTRPRLKELTGQLLKDLDRFQKRAFAKNEIKARAHPRLVLGFHEASCWLRIQKVKLLLIATDCEACPGENGIDETIEGLKLHCQQHSVPYGFPFGRRNLAYVLQKRAQISCVAILDYDGANATFAELLLELEDARSEYKRRTNL
ncbi:hypothetical protein KR018_000127 [Drosophila ironensis]|nr:hypothetical protein KR018_000127 [Drosophila ironensis]